MPEKKKTKKRWIAVGIAAFAAAVAALTDSNQIGSVVADLLGGLLGVAG